MKHWKLLFDDRGTFYAIDKSSGKLTLVASREKQFTSHAEAVEAATVVHDRVPESRAWRLEIKEFDPEEHERKVRATRLEAITNWPSEDNSEEPTP